MSYLKIWKIKFKKYNYIILPFLSSYYIYKLSATQSLHATWPHCSLKPLLNESIAEQIGHYSCYSTDCSMIFDY